MRRGFADLLNARTRPTALMLPFAASQIGGDTVVDHRPWTLSRYRYVVPVGIGASMDESMVGEAREVNHRGRCPVHT